MAEATIGADQNGRPLRTEIDAFFRRFRIVAESEMELWELLLFVSAGERNAAMSERMERTTESGADG